MNPPPRFVERSEFDIGVEWILADIEEFIDKGRFPDWHGRLGGKLTARMFRMPIEGRDLTAWCQDMTFWRTVVSDQLRWISQRMRGEGPVLLTPAVVAAPAGPTPADDRDPVWEELTEVSRYAVGANKAW
jgi:hypothetical protein